MESKNNPPISDKFIRKIDLSLKKWVGASKRKPLLIRGARQVGKTHAVQKLGEESFESFCKIDFEKEPEFSIAFERDLVPQRILKDIEARKKIRIIPGKSLLFFDEIQACPKALMALRYFYEELPELHVIGAGSLLEFVLESPHFSFPVGRLETLYVRPFSFQEFLKMRGEIILLQTISECNLESPIGDATHLHLLRLIKEYFVVGGMPKVCFNCSRWDEIRDEQLSILEMYSNDFGKYSKIHEQKYLRSLFEKVPYIVGEHFKYSKVDPSADSRGLKSALDLLNRSGLIHRVSCSLAEGIPLAASLREKKFKLLFLDIGLLNSKLKVPLDLFLDEDVTLVHSGALAEQFVGQELIAYAHPAHGVDIFYWEREKKGADAEVDYLLEIGKNIIPVEVKAGKIGRMRSLRQFMIEKNSSLGIRISQAPLSFEKGILSIPFYMIFEIERLLKIYL